MKIILVGIWALFLASCTAPASEDKQIAKIISEFGDHLAKIIRQASQEDYQRIWVQTGDEYTDVLGAPLVMKIPVRGEALQSADEIAAGFKKSLASLSARLDGQLSKIEVIETSYLIDSGPVAKTLHLFQFELTMKVRIGGRSCKVVQPGCVQTKRGVAIGDYFLVVGPDKADPTSQP